jgi:glycosyltransferase involved in cell wall biosynthesis
VQPDRNDAVSVVIPSYRRPTDLQRCLAGIATQHRPPAEVIVVYRADDNETVAVLERWQPGVRTVSVQRPGLVAALQAGARAATSDILAFTDDDAVPRSDWLERLMLHFDRADVGAVGGRDVVHGIDGVLTGDAPRVGVVTPLGRMLGNHHLGYGEARPVDILKGVNCAYRRSTYTVPVGLRGEGAEVANDLASSLWVRTHGQVVVYDPTVLVDHYPGTRHDQDTRVAPSRQAQFNATYNTALVLFSLRSDLTRRYLVYQLAVGSVSSPGIVRSLYALARGDRGLLGRVLPTQRAIWAALRAHQRGSLGFWRIGDPIGST